LFWGLIGLWIWGDLRGKYPELEKGSLYANLYLRLLRITHKTCKRFSYNRSTRQMIVSEKDFSGKGWICLSWKHVVYLGNI